MRIAVAQIGSGENKEMNRYMIERLAWSASEAGADMLFLPEYAMFCAGNDRAARNMEAAEPFDGPFVTALSELAAGQGLWICAGMYEQTDGLPYNTVVVIDDEGRLRGTHRKNRLYDAFGYRESEECRAGEQPFEPVETPAGTCSRADKTRCRSAFCTGRLGLRRKQAASLEYAALRTCH